MQQSPTAAETKPTARHTPGPWTVEDPMGPEIISIVANGDAEAYDWKHVAQLAGRPEDDDDIPTLQAEANARLIAAAPDYDAAAREIDRQAGQMDAHLKAPVLISFDAIVALRAAIDKAEGR